MKETGTRPPLGALPSSSPLQPQNLLGSKFAGSQARPLPGCCFIPPRKNSGVIATQSELVWPCPALYSLGNPRGLDNCQVYN